MSMTREQKAHHARAIAEAIGTEDPSALGSAVIDAVVENNPDLAPYKALGAETLALALRRLYSRVEGDESAPSRLSWLVRLWPW